MAKQTYTLILAFIFMIGATAFTTNTDSTLKVNVSGVKASDGYIHLIIFNQSIGFPANPAKAYRHLKSKASTGQQTITINDLPYGTYSIVIFHDRNANEKFDKSWFGNPKEDYGFTNIPGEFCGVPSFRQTSFTVNQPYTSIGVKLMNVK